MTVTAIQVKVVTAIKVKVVIEIGGAAGNVHVSCGAEQRGGKGRIDGIDFGILF